jgi:hypothetical protein
MTWLLTAIKSPAHAHLTDWRCYEIPTSEEWGLVKVFVGWHPAGMVVTTGDLVEFDAQRRVGITNLGNTYKLEGPAGTSDVAPGKSRWRDITEEVHALMQAVGQP